MSRSSNNVTVRAWNGGTAPIVAVAHGRLGIVQCWEDGSLALMFRERCRTNFVVYLGPAAARKVRARLRRFTS